MWKRALKDKKNTEELEIKERFYKNKSKKSKWRLMFNDIRLQNISFSSFFFPRFFSVIFLCVCVFFLFSLSFFSHCFSVFKIFFSFLFDFSFFAFVLFKDFSLHLCYCYRKRSNSVRPGFHHLFITPFPSDSFTWVWGTISLLRVFWVF